MPLDAGPTPPAYSAQRQAGDGAVGMFVDAATVLGLVVAVAQLIRLGRLSRATYDAVKATTEQFGEYNILLLIPELGRIEAECELAVAHPDEAAIRRLLQRWRDVGGELRGFLAPKGESADEFMTALQRSLAQATRAKTKLNEGGDLGAATLSVRDAMTKACEAGRAFGATVRVGVDLAPPPKSLWEFVREKVSGNHAKERTDG